MKMKTLVSVALLAASLCLAPLAAEAAPIVTCATNLIVLECTSTNGAAGRVQASVQEPNATLAVTVVWAVNGRTAQTVRLPAGSAVNPTNLVLAGTFRPGTNEVSITASNGVDAAASCSTTVIVQDTIPPVIHSVVATPNKLWPPNHKLVTVKVGIRATDACGPLRYRIVRVESNEPEDGSGDGTTSPDYVFNRQWVRASPVSLQLRAERSGNASGRTYTVWVSCADPAGNEPPRPAAVTVVVPHDQGKAKGKK
jgi:hypothetical protein